MGDFNYRTINWTNWISEAPPGHISHEFIECIRDSFLHQHVQNDTRFRGSVCPSNLDLVFSNDELLTEDLSLTFNLLCDINEKINPTYESNSYLYHKGDYESMKRHLNSLNWDLEFNEKTLEEKWETFKSSLQHCVENFIPKKYVGNMKNKTKLKPVWMTKEAIKSVKMKHRAWSKYMRTRDYIH